MMKKISALAVMTIAVAAAAGSIGYAAEGGNSTTITAVVSKESHYTLEIPAATSVAGFGWTELASNLKVKGELVSGKSVRVDITSKNTENGSAALKDADSGKSIPYTLKLQQTDAQALKSVTFAQKDIGDEGKKLGLYVTQDDWNAVPGGTYSDVLTFSASLI